LYNIKYRCIEVRNVSLNTYCVEAKVLPSGLKAAAMVDRGAGCRGQYLAVQ
jgi:hypothetical protein